MSYEVQAVQRIRAFVESTFGADSSASAGSFTDLPIREGTAQMTLTRDELDPMQLVQYRLEGRERVLGKRMATLTFTMNLAPTGTAAVTGTTAVTSPLGILLKAVMGGESLNAGSTVATGSTATVPIVGVASHYSRWAAGRVMGWDNGTHVEWRKVESIASSGSITLSHGFSAVPSTGAALYNAAHYYMTEDPTQSLAFIIDGVESDDRWLLTGGQAVGGVTLAFDLTGAQIPAITFNFTCAKWYDSSETASSLTGSIAAATYTNTSPIVAEAGEFRAWTVGAATFVTSTRLHVSAMTWEPHIAYVPVTSPSGTNTVLRWRASRNADSPVQGSFTLPYEDTTWFAGRNNKTDYDLTYQGGTAAGSAVILKAPTVQALNPQRAADAGGLSAQVVMWKGRRDTDVGSSTTDEATSPFHIYLG